MVTSLERAFAAITKNPVVIRFVALLLLLISDLDVVLSLLFQYNLWILGGIYHYFLFVTQVGNLTYVLGVCVFGPKQKYKMIKIVGGMMLTSPAEFIGEDKNGKKVQVDMTTRLSPHDVSMNPKTFAQVELTPEGLKEFEGGLSAYQLMHMWTAALRKNTRNRVERKHGIPFFRTAKFGFMSDPTPMDLGMILNANALYTFATGVIQMAVGVLILYKLELNLVTILPVSVSFVSLVLSLANVFLNFSAILAELESERVMTENIINASECDRVRGQAEVRKTLENETSAIKEKYVGKKSAADLAAHEKDIESAHDRYQLKTNSVDQQHIQVLEVQLNNHRQRLARIKAIQRGTVVQSNKKVESVIDAYARAKAPWEAQLSSLQRSHQAKLSELDPEAVDAATFRQQADALEKEFNEKEAYLKNKLEEVQKKNSS